MAESLELVAEDYQMGLYDNRSPDDKNVVAYKIVDASDWFPDWGRSLLKYADVTRGRICQLSRGGMLIHWHINEYNLNAFARELVYMAVISEGRAGEFARFVFDNQ